MSTEPTGIPTPTIAVVAPAASALPAPTAAWLAAIEPLTSQLELSDEVVTRALVDAKLVKAPNDKGAAALVDADAISDVDFAKAFPDATSGDLRLAVKTLRLAAAPKAEPTPAAPAVATGPFGTGFPGYQDFLIPDAPLGTGLLDILRDTQDLIVDRNTVSAGIEALFAWNMGLDTIPEKLSNRMEAAAKEARRPVSADLRKIEKLVRERRYADVNIDGRLVTEARKRELIAALAQLPEVMYQFHGFLSAWDAQRQSMLQGNLAAQLQGRRLYPPFEPVVTAAESVVNTLNEAFSGYGVDVAAALAYEAVRVREILEQADLYLKLGYPNKELMFRGLEIGVPSGDRQMHRAVASYVAFVAVDVRNMPTGEEGPRLEALFIKGEGIKPWMVGEYGRPSKGDRSSTHPNGSGRGAPIPGGTDRVRSRGLPIEDESTDRGGVPAIRR